MLALQVSQGWLFPMATAICFLERVREPGNGAPMQGLQACSGLLRVAMWVSGSVVLPTILSNPSHGS